MTSIQMVDLTTQLQHLGTEIDDAISGVLRSGQFINGEAVQLFSQSLSRYTGSQYVVPCANGTDALQIALMALELNSEDEVLVPAFTYAATAEVCALLGITPVLVDVDPLTFNIDEKKVEEAITARTKAIIPVHLFGQCCHMEPILKIAKKYNLYVIEDNAQSIGSVYTFSDGTQKQAGTMGNVGITSFFPTKNLGCYGDGGALFTNDEALAKRLRMIASHGQSQKYIHEVIGCNSRLDTIQAAILEVKIKHLDSYTEKRREAARIYHEGLASLAYLTLPSETDYSTHVYHQFTIKVENGKRDDLQQYLKRKGIPSMIYYPIPLSKQPAFCNIMRVGNDLKETEQLCDSALSLPMHTELSGEQLNYIIEQLSAYE